MTARLQGKQTVITGATGGIGRAACRIFCEEGASVIGTDVDPAGGRELERELRSAGHDFSYLGCDVSSSADVAALATAVKDRFGGLDVLYNNAGIILGKPLVEMTEDEWDRILGVNLRGTFLTMRELVPLMAGRQASIVNMSSGLGLVGAEMLTAYSRLEGRRDHADEVGGARAGAGHPRQRDLPRRDRHADAAPDQPGRAGEEFMRSFEAIHVAGRLGRPEEVVAAAVFLASDEASFVTGSVMTVDSGATAQMTRPGGSMRNANPLKLGLFSMQLPRRLRDHDRPRALGADLGEQHRGRPARRRRPASSSCSRSAAGAATAAPPTSRASSFETITWASGLLANTRSITVFGTIHAPMIHPIVAAKQMATVDLLSQRPLRAQPRLRLESGRVRDVRQGAARARRALRLRAGVARRRPHDLARGRAPVDFDGRYFKLPGLSATRSPTAARSRC